MKVLQTSRHRGAFEPFAATDQAQAAMMQLPPGETSDDELNNEHPHSEQWLFVVSGTGAASVVARNGKSRRVKLRSGTLVVIERGELHQIKNTGKRLLNTINFYIPPAYRSDGRLRRRSRGGTPRA